MLSSNSSASTEIVSSILAAGTSSSSSFVCSSDITAAASQTALKAKSSPVIVRIKSFMFEELTVAVAVVIVVAVVGSLSLLSCSKRLAFIERSCYCFCHEGHF